MKKIIPALALLLVSAVLLSTASFAWFSMNRTVTATNMSVKATTGASLVISKSTNFTAGTTEVTNTVHPVLMPATKYVSQTDVNGDSITASKDLVYVVNGGAVDPLTGLAYTTTGAEELYYDAANTEADLTTPAAGYYYDYVYYLAAEGAEDITTGNLKITIDATDAATTVTTPGSGTETVLRATSVLVYVGTELVTSTPILVKSGDSKQTLKALSTTVKIPQGAPGDVPGALKVTLRVYIDGALIDAEYATAHSGDSDYTPHTYVRNASIIDLDREFSFDVQFDVE